MTSEYPQEGGSVCFCYDYHVDARPAKLRDALRPVCNRVRYGQCMLGRRRVPIRW